MQTGRVGRQDLNSLVTASGEVRPKNYTNVLGEGIGKITDIVVKEGDQVKKGDVLLHLENIQPGADVQLGWLTWMKTMAGPGWIWKWTPRLELFPYGLCRRRSC